MASSLISLVPVILKEASLDSPTFRGTVLHYAEQVDILEKWLDGFLKASIRLVHDVQGLEESLNNFLLRAYPANVSELVVDHDYTLLAMQKYSEGSKGFWTNIIAAAKKADKTMVEPLTAFQRGELKSFKENRRVVEATQAKYDTLLARYLSQSKSKEPSSLREDAFQLYEARKVYMKSCYDFCVAVSIFRANLDRLLTQVVTNQWQMQMHLRKETTIIAERCQTDIDRVRAWCDSVEASEPLFRMQLLTARKELESRTRRDHHPGRELEEYAVSTVPYLSSRPTIGAPMIEGEETPSEKQGWLFMRNMTGKPTRTVWIRRWFFVKAGIFGWLVQGYRSGGAEESEKVGVLLCNIKPAVQEDRRFCFEVKTKDTTILLQTETQADLTTWLAVFEQAKRTAVESSSISSSSQAFSILPPSAPAPPSEPAYVTKGHEGNTMMSADGSSHISRHFRREGRHGSDEDGILSIERSATLGPFASGSYSRAASMDVARGDTPMLQPSGTFDRLGHRLDVHRKIPSSVERAMSPISPGGGSAGISALIAASHTALPFQVHDGPKSPHSEHYKSTTLAPNTLVGTPSPVNLATAATVTSGSGITSGGMDILRQPGVKGHRKTLSLNEENGHGKDGPSEYTEYPLHYPLELRIQDEHLKMLFPGPRSDILLLVFRAVWSPGSTQELPGRCFVTERNIYFYSHHLGLVFTTIIPFSTLKEVKAAPEKDCDYLFLHLEPEKGAVDTGSQVTIKTFLEPLRLLQRRLHLLVKSAHNGKDHPVSTQELLSKLSEMEFEAEKKSMDEESWEDVGLFADGNGDMGKRRESPEFKIQIDDNLLKTRGNDDIDKVKETSRIKLPTSPIVYIPPNMDRKPLEREFGISTKALFHVMFGDKSITFQRLYAERQARHLRRDPWKVLENGKLRRQFAYQVNFYDFFGRSRRADVVDHQTVEIQEDHLCYVITDIKTPWHLPYRQDFALVSKIVITHVAKSKSKMSVWTEVRWTNEPRFLKHIVEGQALYDLENDALDLGDVVADQVRKLGKDSTTNKAVYLFGQVGGQDKDTPPTPPGLGGVVIDAPEIEPRASRNPIKQRRLSLMLLETLLSFTFSAVSNMIMFTFTALQKMGPIISVYRFLILALAVSLVGNMVLASRSTISYWTEHRANKLINRIGIEPNGIMSRAVYLQDLNEVVKNVSDVRAHHSDSDCYRKFREIAIDTDLDTDYEDGTPSFAGKATRNAARRLKFGRQRLGIYRHDLLVALRVVNGLEKELVVGEWENWLVEEMQKCRHAHTLLDWTVESGDEEARKLAPGLGEYCGACAKELKLVDKTGLI